MSAHTPGPWISGFGISSTMVYGGHNAGTIVAKEASESDARLIAAAPEMYADLLWYAENAVNMVEHPEEYRAAIRNRAAQSRAIIRKATGEA